MSEKRKRLLQEIDADVWCDTLDCEPDIQTRPIRPRPLPYNEKLRVWAWDDPEFAKFNPNLARWAKNRVALAASLTNLGEKSLPKARKSKFVEKDLSEEIQIPGFTSLDDLPHLSNRDHLERSKSVGERAYIRHIERTQEELEDLVEYDLDSDDEEWLQNRASKGLEDLNRDLLERLMDKFENAMRSTLRQQQLNWEREGSNSSDTAPEDKDPGILYPASNAIQDFGQEYNSLTIRAAHNYWAQKAAKSKAPLLQRFWFDKRWAKQNAVKTRREEDSDDDSSSGVPFQGKEAPKKVLRGRVMTSDDMRHRLFAARTDLELVRTLADQVKRREKVRKRLLLAWQQELRVSIALAQKSKKSPLKTVSTVGLPAQIKTNGKAKPATAPKGGPSQAKAKAKAKPKVLATTGNKRVRFDPKVEEANKQTEKVMSPQRSGIVSAVVDQLRRLSSWGSPKSNSESPKTQLDHPVDAEILADLGMPSKILQKSVRNKSMRKPKGQGKKAPRTTKQGTEKLVASCRKTGVKSRNESLDLPAISDCAITPSEFAKEEDPDTRKVQWIVKQKNTKIALKSILEIQRFLEKHGLSRDIWKPLLKQNGESDTAYRKRLRNLFSFAPSTEESWSSVPKKQSNSKQQPKSKKGNTIVKKVISKARAQPKGKVVKTNKAKISKLQGKSKSRVGKDKSLDLIEALAEAGTSSIKRQTRSGAVFSETLPLVSISSRTRSNQVSEDEGSQEIDSEVGSGESSSGSDTCVAADSDLSEEELELVQSPLRLTRKTVKSPSKSQKRSVNCERSDSEGSTCSSESDMATLSPPRHTPTVAKRVIASKSRRGITQRRNQGIVAAARQRARAAKQRV